MIERENIKKQSIIGLIWKFIEKAGTQVISFVVQIILARILIPEDYGLIGYLTIFITLSEVFIQQGFTTALIQKSNIDELDFSSVFYINIIISIIIYVICFWSAPFVSKFYNIPELISVMRVLMISVIIGAFSAVQTAIISRTLDFKKSLYRGLLNIIIYGSIGIILAFHDFGVWSLVYARLAGALVGCIVLWIVVDWRPKMCFSIKRIKILFNYSSKLLGANIFSTFFSNLSTIVIGKVYSSTALGYFQRGQSIPQTIMTSIDGSISEVMYPTFSLLQNEKVTLKSALRRTIKLSIFIVLPILVGLLVVSEDLTILLLTEKWLPSVPYMQVMCIYCSLWPFNALTHAMNALGESGLTFKLLLISNIICLCIMVALIRYGVIWIIVGSIISSAIYYYMIMRYVKHFLEYSLLELMKDILPEIIVAVLMGVSVWIIGEMIESLYIRLIIQIILGVVIYFCGCCLIKVESLYYFYDVIKLKK